MSKPKIYGIQKKFYICLRIFKKRSLDCSRANDNKLLKKVSNSSEKRWKIEIGKRVWCEKN